MSWVQTILGWWHVSNDELYWFIFILIYLVTLWCWVSRGLTNINEGKSMGIRWEALGGEKLGPYQVCQAVIWSLRSVIGNWPKMRMGNLCWSTCKRPLALLGQGEESGREIGHRNFDSEVGLDLSILGEGSWHFFLHHLIERAGLPGSVHSRFLLLPSPSFATHIDQRHLMTDQGTHTRIFFIWKLKRDEQRWTEMNRDEKRWKEMNRDEQRWKEMKRDEKRWKEYIQTVWNGWRLGTHHFKELRTFCICEFLWPCWFDMVWYWILRSDALQPRKGSVTARWPQSLFKEGWLAWHFSYILAACSSEKKDGFLGVPVWTSTEESRQTITTIGATWYNYCGDHETRLKMLQTSWVATSPPMLLVSEDGPNCNLGG